MIDELLMEHHDTKEPQVEQWEELPLIKELDEDSQKKAALSIFFRNELGRQGIEDGKDLKKLKQKVPQESDDNDLESKRARLIIKKYWRGAIDRFQMQLEREKELLFLGIKIDEGQMDRIEDNENDIFQFIQKRSLPEGESNSHK